MLRQRLDNQIKLHPGNVAIYTAAGQVTYEELGLQANRVAFSIRACLAGRQAAAEQNVGLLFDHGAESIIAIAGAVLSGCAYVPIYASSPLERIVSQVEHARIGVIVTASRYAAVIAGIRSRQAIEVIYLDELTGSRSEQDAAPAANPDGYLYLLHTSGSTGMPKAVMQTGENVLHFIDNLRARIGLTSSDGILMFAHFAFDAAVVDIFSVLLSGAALYPYALHQQSRETILPEYLLNRRITIWHSVPSLFRHFTGVLAEDRVFPGVRTLLLGGEPVRIQDVQACRKHFPNATFGNIYGQTESSINSLWLLPPQIEAYQLSTGEPLGDTQLLVAGDDGTLVEHMGVGQIVVASRHVALGYWDDLELTSKVFSEDPALGKLYWTGDMGRLLPDGHIEFSGRRDHQIKIRGMRVELGEIENCLCGHPGVADAIITCTYEQDEVLYLSCYWKAQAGHVLQARDIRAYVARFLPEYMVPQRYLLVPEWPRNANGKIDRRALPAIPDGDLDSPAPTATGREGKVLEIWKRVLQKESVGLHTNFFDAGGNSLKLFQLQSLYVEYSGEIIPLARFFEYPTIREFAGFIDRTGEGAEEQRKPAKGKPANRLTDRKKRLDRE